ncbi:hypothetical protein PHYBOEH_002511 [Phytophthora boehmeriae]|uniref:FYVE-type domain-containing protein n=1 Tax=Phytophthora boehmeriae TaxID=109152 RepID=A0A8T1WS49_9STRA|nr:hypothetical protein PHYBOEH_002511 [Phytophthora boehmeriae]
MTGTAPTTGSTRRATSAIDGAAQPEFKVNPHYRRPTVPVEHQYPKAIPPNISRQSPQIKLNDGEADAFRHLAHSIVSRTLAYECEYRQLGSPELSSSKWKLLKRHEQLSIYKKRGQKSDDDMDSNKNAKTPSVLCVGSLEGSLEDILYGTHSKNRDEMQATAGYLHNSHMDCAVLSVLESGTDDDPFRQLTLKWFITEMFGDARLVNHRDWFNIESIGISTDAWGRRYGYFLAKHVEHSGCPPMPADSDVVRGKMAMCCIYRQEPRSRVVDVYAKGSVDLGGGLPGFLTAFAPVAMMLSLEVYMQSAEGKRLTAVALEHAKGREGNPKNSETTESLIDMLAASTISSSISSSEDTTAKKPKSSTLPCSVCGKKAALSKLVRASHHKCGICKERVCSKCYVKRNLFGRKAPVSVVCCKVCILASKRQEIDPRQPTPILPPTS